MVAWVSMGVAVACAVVIAVDEVRHPQAMAVMNVVWPVTALYLSVLGVWAYFVAGEEEDAGGDARDEDGSGCGRDSRRGPEVAVGTSHCGAGCALVADVASELWIAAAGVTLLGSVAVGGVCD